MILIKNGRLLDPYNGIDDYLDVLINNDKIHKIGKFYYEDNMFNKVIDASGCVISPGLIDAHVHFRDPGFTYKEDLNSGSKAALRGGYTSVVCMANTKPPVDNKYALCEILSRAKKLPINLYQCACITKGMQGRSIVNMDELVNYGARGFSDDGMPIMDSKLVREAMNIATRLNIPLSFHEEDSNLIINPGINDGPISKKFGLKGALSEAEDVLVARDCMLALKTGSKINIQHLSSRQSVEIVRLSKKLGANLFTEVTPHHFTLTEDDVEKYGTNAKMNPPLRSEEDRIKLIEGLRDKTIDIIATDHAPHSKEEKEKEFTSSPSGIIGLETALSLGIMNLVDKGYLNLSELIEKMSVNPAKLYNLSSGKINEGEVADIVIFNPYKIWKADKFYSKADNSPFKNCDLKGKVEYTICRGKIEYIANK